MALYLIDVNLPYYFSLWNSADYLHQKDIDDTWPDAQIWDYARENNLTIITKDADFSNKILLREPPPRIVHIRFGNMKMKQFHEVLARLWPEVLLLSTDYKLINVFENRIEAIN